MTEPKPQPTQFELTYWRTIQSSKNPKDFEAYLSKYPDGHYAELARNRIPPMLSTRQGGERILEIVSELSGVSLLKLRSARRSREVVRPRQVAIHLMCNHTELSLPMIGRVVGNRDHTTVIYGRRAIDKIVAEAKATEQSTIDLLNKAQALLAQKEKS